MQLLRPDLPSNFACLRCHMVSLFTAVNRPTMTAETGSQQCKSLQPPQPACSCERFHHLVGVTWGSVMTLCQVLAACSKIRPRHNQLRINQQAKNRRMLSASWQRCHQGRQQAGSPGRTRDVLPSAAGRPASAWCVAHAVAVKRNARAANQRWSAGSLQSIADSGIQEMLLDCGLSIVVGT